MSPWCAARCSSRGAMRSLAEKGAVMETRPPARAGPARVTRVERGRCDADAALLPGQARLAGPLTIAMLKRSDAVRALAAYEA